MRRRKKGRRNGLEGARVGLGERSTAAVVDERPTAAEAGDGDRWSERRMKALMRDKEVERERGKEGEREV